MQRAVRVPIGRIVSPLATMTLLLAVAISAGPGRRDAHLRQRACGG